MLDSACIGIAQFCGRAEASLSVSLVDFERKFRIAELELYRTRYWSWSLRPHQATLGAGIISLNRACGKYSEVLSEEHSDFQSMIGVVEAALAKAFGYDAINYLMLMMFDKQVHFHVLPRYESERVVGGTKWEDLAWPGIPRLMGEESDSTLLKEIRRAIQTQIA